MRKILSFMLAFSFLMNIAILPCHASTPEENTAITTYQSIPEGVLETTTINEGGSISTIHRKIYSNGTIEVIIDQMTVATLECDNFQAYWDLIGTTKEYSLTPVLVAPAYESYGCGKEYMIHKFVNSESYTIYGGTAISSVSSITKILAAAFTVPIAAGLLTVATAIYNAFNLTGNTPYKMHVALSNYMLFDVDTDEFVMNCHHYLIGEYNEAGVLTASYMRYGVS